MRMQEIAKIYKQKQKELKQIDVDYIKNFSKISVRNVCLDLGVTYENVMTGTASINVIKKVRNEIERRLKVISGE